MRSIDTYTIRQEWAYKLKYDIAYIGNCKYSRMWYRDIGRLFAPYGRTHFIVMVF